MILLCQMVGGCHVPSIVVVTWMGSHFEVPYFSPLMVPAECIWHVMLQFQRSSGHENRISGCHMTIFQQKLILKCQEVQMAPFVQPGCSHHSGRRPKVRRGGAGRGDINKFCGHGSDRSQMKLASIAITVFMDVSRVDFTVNWLKVKGQPSSLQVKLVSLDS